MQLAQLLKAPTPKQFVCISFIYAIVAPVVGVLIAEPLTSAIMMVLLLGFAFITLFYIQPAIPPTFSNAMSGMPLLMIIYAFAVIADVAYIDLPEDKSQLEQVTGTVPYRIVQTKYFPSALVIGQVSARCDYQDYDDCSRMRDYKGKQATMMYQPKTRVDNLAFEIEVDGQKIYDFDSQLAAYQAEKDRQRKELFWVVVLFLLPNVWLYWQDKRIRKEKPKMLYSEVRQSIARQKKNAGLTAIISMFVMVDMVIAGVGAMLLAAHYFVAAAGVMTIFALASATTYWLIKPVKE